MQNYDVNEKGYVTVALTLELPEVEALHKTLGIAISNLLGKVSKANGAVYGNVAAADLSLLSGIQKELLAALADLDQAVHS